MEMQTMNCLACKFWVAKVKTDSAATENTKGCCHRRAPPAMPYATYILGEAVYTLLWLYEDETNHEHTPIESFENNTARWADWPVTAGYDWCGEFEKKKPDAKSGQSRGSGTLDRSPEDPVTKKSIT